jgi:hypothetical protein
MGWKSSEEMWSIGDYSRVAILSSHLENHIYK